MTRLRRAIRHSEDSVMKEDGCKNKTAKTFKVA